MATLLQMCKLATLVCGICLLCGAAFAAEGSATPNAITPSGSKEKPQPRPGFTIDPQTWAVAEETPRARYLRNARTLIGIRWNAYVTPTASWSQLQTVRIAFKIAKGGTITDVRIFEDDSAIEEFRALALKAVKDTKLPRTSAGVDAGATGLIATACRFSVVAP